MNINNVYVKVYLKDFGGGQMLFRIREIRELRNLTKSQLAKKAGISTATISKLENYKESPTIETLEKIAIALNVKVADLLDE